MIRKSLLGGLLVLAANVSADDAIPISQVPKPVMDAFAADHPGAQAVRIQFDSDDGVRTYEIKFREGRRKIKATYSVEGKRLSVKGKGDDDDD